MKSKLLLLSFLMLFTFTTNYAQTSASQSGIAVQGIARNSDNTALTSSTVKLSFELYYVDVKTGNRETIGGMKEVPLDTDAFGVFSHVIPVLPINFSLIANNAVHLTILDSKKETISDELLKQVPYAIAASNGVPTGCIMPYVGELAPDGWVLCQGQDLTGDVRTKILRDLLGSDNAPHLGGRFLKGTGTPTEANVDSITLNDEQDQSTRTKQHTHLAGSLNANSKSTIGSGENVATLKSKDEANEPEKNKFTKYGVTPQNPTINSLLTYAEINS
jgi:microcystin-dependent protein